MARQLAATLALLVIAALAIASGAAAAERLSVRSLFDVCDDKKPSGRHSCDEQKAWGKCDEKWFVDGNFCRKTCGKCVEFDPRTAELNLRRVMKQCALTDKRTADACIGMLTGDDDFISAGGKLVTHSRKTDSPAQPVDSTRESFLSVEELLESEAFMETLQVCKVDCLVAHSEDNLVHSLVETFLEKHGAKSEKLAETIFTAESVARILLDFFKHVGCSMEQFVSIVPKLYRTLLEHNPIHDTELLLKVYELEDVDEASNTTITYTSEFQGHPSVSTCMAKSLKNLLSVRKCTGYNCYNSRG